MGGEARILHGLGGGDLEFFLLAVVDLRGNLLSLISLKPHRRSKGIYTNSEVQSLR
jgi:hypothetical protein